MTPKEYIINCAKELVKSFPNTKVRYENHELSNTHFIEVVPNEVYNLNTEYKIWEENIVFDFIAKFPNQNICFLSDDAIVGIDNSEFELKGVLYDLLFSFNKNCYQRLDTIKIIQTDQLFPLLSDFSISQPTTVLSGITGLSFNISTNSFFNERFVSCDAIGKTVIEKSFENNFAKAA